MMAYALIRLDSIFVAIMFGLFLYQNVQYYKSPWQQPRPMP
jgi:hypothetical protein